MTDRLRACWQAQPTEGTPMTVADIETRIRRFRARKRCEAAAIVPAGLAMAAFFVWLSWTAPSNLARLGGLVDLAWALALALAAWWRWLRPRPLEAAFLANLDFHRRQLIAERNERRNLWLWCFLPLAPAYALLVAGSPHPWGARTLVADGVMIAGFIAAGLAAYVGTKRLQRQIDALNSL